MGTQIYKIRNIFLIVGIISFLNGNVSAQDKSYKNKIRISYGGNIMFNKLVVNYGQDPLNYILPNVQYQRQFDNNKKYGLLLLFSIAQFHDFSDTYSYFTKYPHLESIGVMHLGFGFSYDNSFKKINYHISSGFLIRQGQEVSWVNDHPQTKPEPYYYTKDLRSYGVFLQTSFEYKLSKSIAALSIVRYNLLAYARNHTITFDLGIAKKF